MTTPFEEGSPKSKICILAEAPASAEMRLGIPLVGPSGKVFDDCLHEAGLIRQQLYILNVFPFQVTKVEGRDAIYRASGEREPLWNGRSGFTNSGLEYVEQVRNKIEASGCTTIVPLGAVAMNAVTPHRQIMKWRGSILPYTGKGRKKVIPTIHPAASLRGKYIWRYNIIHDLDRARRECSTSELNLPNRNLIINPSMKDIEEFMNYVGNHNRFATDVELLGAQISCFSLCVEPLESMCIPLVGEHGNRKFSLEDELSIWDMYSNLLTNPKIEKVNQNILFEMFCFSFLYGILIKGTVNDPMIAQHIMYPDFPKGLDFICSIRTREPYYKDDGKIWKKPWPDVDLEKFWRYNALDSPTALESWIAIEEEMNETDYRGTYDFTMSLLEPLLFMELNGISVDTEALEKQKQTVKDELKAAEEELDRIAEKPFNPQSPKQCQNYFYSIKGIKPYVSPKTRRVTTDDIAMSRIVRRYNMPEARLVQRIRKLNKLLETYMEVGFDADGRLRCSYNPRGTTTGRLSSSQTIFGSGMNFQNIHPDFKGFLEPD